MSPQKLTEILKSYRTAKARYAYLQAQLEMLNRFLLKCEGEMVNDLVSMGQAIDGMPHGTRAGDPTGRLALDIASGDVSPFVRQIRAEIEEVAAEIQALAPDVKTAEIVLEALNDREREVFVLKMIDNCSWAEILGVMNGRHGGTYSKRSLQRLYDRAEAKAFEVVK